MNMLSKIKSETKQADLKMSNFNRQNTPPFLNKLGNWLLIAGLVNYAVAAGIDLFEITSMPQWLMITTKTLAALGIAGKLWFKLYGSGAINVDDVKEQIDNIAKDEDLKQVKDIISDIKEKKQDAIDVADIKENQEQEEKDSTKSLGD